MILFLVAENIAGRLIDESETGKNIIEDIVYYIDYMFTNMFQMTAHNASYAAWIFDLFQCRCFRMNNQSMLSVLRHSNTPTRSYGRTVAEFLEEFTYDTLNDDDIQLIIRRVKFTGGRLPSASVLVTLIQKIDITDNAHDVNNLLWKLFVAMEDNLEQVSSPFCHLPGDEFEIALYKWFMRLQNGAVNVGVTELEDDIFVAHVNGCFQLLRTFSRRDYYPPFLAVTQTVMDRLLFTMDTFWKKNSDRQSRYTFFEGYNLVSMLAVIQ